MLGAILALCGPSAHADLALFLQEDAGNIVEVAHTTDFNPLGVSFSGTFGPGGIGGTDFTVTIQGASSDNGATLSDLLTSANKITNTSSVTHTLHLWASQDNYSLPAGTPLQVESGMGGSITNPTLTLTGVFQAYADKNNDLLGTPTAGAAITDFTNGLQNATASASTYGTGSAFGSFTRTGDYSLTQVANITLTAGGKINFAAHENVTAIPEPSTMAIAGLGALGLIGYGLWRRRA
jgi:MYXO-CTERM domain-containing protein